MRKQTPAPIDEAVQTGLPGITPPRTDHVAADPRRGYVAGGYYSWTQLYLRALPFYVDDLTRDFGDDLYDRMLHDACVWGCVDDLKLQVISDGLHIMPARKEGEDGYDLALEIADFCGQVLDALPVPFLQVTLYELLDALAYGHKIAEQVYHVPDGGPLAGKLVLQRLKVKPRRSYAFVVDSWTNTLGILALIPGVAFPVLVNSIVADPGQIPNLLPRSKFAVLVNRPKDDDPRGTSILRAAYDPWWLKCQTKGEAAAYTAQFGRPGITGETAEGAIDYQQTGADGEPLFNADGTPKLITPEDAMRAALEGYRSGGVVVTPFGSKVNVIQPQGEGAFVRAMLDWYDAQITYAIAHQKLATQDAKHGSRAQAEVHQDTKDEVIAHARLQAAGMIRGDILRPLVLYNYGPEALALVPGVSLTEVEGHDFAKVSGAIAGLETSGYLHPSQYPETDAMLGLPKRSPEAIAEAVERKRQAGKPAPGKGDEEDEGEDA